MKRIAGCLLILAGALSAAVRWIDLVNFTDLSTGFILTGSVWARYAVLLGLVAAAALGSLMAGQGPADRPVGCCTFVSAAGFAVVGGIGIVGQMLSGPEMQMMVFSVLELACAWWLTTLGLVCLAPRPEKPVGGVLAGILCTALFYILVIQRFATNASSYYRVGQTSSVFSALAALLFAAALLRGVTYPGGNNGKNIYFFGMCAFYLCTCCEGPQAICFWMCGNATVGQTALSLALALFGLLGAVAAQTCLWDKKPNPASMKSEMN